MRKKVILITGAAGEIGQALIKSLAATGSNQVLSLDLHDLPDDMDGYSTHILGDVLDKNLFARLVTEYDFDVIYHLAALLSTRSEFAPELAHQVNVNGTLLLMQMAAEQSQRRGEPVRFIFPSSIAVYGLPDLETKARDFYVREWDWNYPTTMYGCNKLYCEMLGTYFGSHYQQLSRTTPTMLDFRAVRFPGLISAYTTPSGGTSDYGPEMLHAAAQGKPYACFVREDSVIPFMAMPDAVTSLLQLAAAERAALRRTVYNVTSFSLTAVQFRDEVLKAFPNAQITFEPDVQRQGIVDSWPAGLADKAARRDWGWEPAYGVERAFAEYLVPNIRQRYQ
ncbi:MAG: NAD-dependent epimerase/dehydratase family protein [Chloroflexi bacterium]|nr:NAD-dependent epimerase/dehydratase family protein [Chloroflexota bacterium]MBK7177750.1 NAD-dependent epimerase/dehydratase family protein [Chloroflexota bacterium]MBK8935698.1 NAD-dependent epimerase/dehydratase family protein [Chloroflexota bacterium]MBP7590771.1 NAD-dependent epimerase/dehydratase family protein [Chloroflexota bacterium]